MKTTHQTPTKEEKRDAARQDRTETPAPKGGQQAVAGELSEEDLQSIAGGPTAVERRH